MQFHAWSHVLPYDNLMPFSCKESHGFQPIIWFHAWKPRELGSGIPLAFEKVEKYFADEKFIALHCLFIRQNSFKFCLFIWQKISVESLNNEFHSPIESKLSFSIFGNFTNHAIFRKSLVVSQNTRNNSAVLNLFS